MVCRCRAQFRSKRRAAKIIEFISVYLEWESQRPSLGQDLTRLLKGKGFRLSEDIHKGQSVARSVSLPPFF